ncbi:Acetoin dehydrogenase operon transcriptional activator AcoR [Clostridium ljungdahlii DSM 13528]|uniref:Acetoin dehydrogenase operon transcriptional activator AcoR n=2 Tax=Clostridium TaxID=1485 RepID=D8GL96_CLOLD|nr:predicted sigma-54-interacting transcription regulator [Clostridium ljungdahlii DSM 13528]ALU34873.1 Transcriptional regulator with sigma-54 interaction and Fis-type DNA-binding domains [Clostridium autoethanogenum DSM 10061]OAA88557.1 Acetoin dehydrogenase operon transcriptional activator AcoR [Clostridium ljungdahlii DSM 13528]OVY51594.1 Acetoin dehydrogenase operon transcriptional activator AcoR [Clostridium autoethanogenum]
MEVVIIMGGIIVNTVTSKLDNEAVYKTDIELSHERCKKFGIDSRQVFSKKILYDNELQKKFAANRNLILTAAPYMEQLINFVKGFNFFVLLTDGEGCILNALGDEKILSKAFSLKMVPGAFMNEENIGTNSMSMVISTKMPVQVSGDDHFIRAYHKWTCSAAPIKDSKGRLIGVLNLTGYAEFVHSHTLGMVIAASNAIEEMLKVKECNKIQNMNYKHIKNIFNSSPVSIITSDINGKIKICNKKAQDMFGIRGNKLEADKMEDIIENWNDIKTSIYLGQGTSKETNIVAVRNKTRYQLTTSSIYNCEDDNIEVVYVFEEIKMAKKRNDGQAYYTFDKIIGQDESFMRIIEYAKKISDSKSTILIMGESGTGKEVFAQSIHNYSSRVDGPFIALNCGAIPKQLIESELFGYEEGAFTGAKKGGNLGKFELADGGTIMLDEIGEMPLDMQTKLLRVVQEGVITKIGSSKSIPVDVRIVAVTNRDLKKEVERGRFRKDLYYRLNVLPLYLPPLRERKKDIPLLIQYFIKSISQKLNKKQPVIPGQYLQKMINYSWPGNIRELENVVELIINTESVPAGYFSEESCNNDVFVNINEDCLKLDYVEREHLVKVLKKFKGNITHSAAALGIRRNTLYSKIKKYKIEM